MKEKEVIGQLGLIPVKLKYEKEIYDAQWTCDLMVLPELRKSGIGRKLFTEALKRDVISIGNNPSPAADAVMHKLGFKPVRSGRTMIFPINSEHILKWALSGKYEFAVPLLNKFIQPYFSVKKNKLTKKKSDFKICRWEDVAELIELNQKNIQRAHIVHDEKFLQWRATGFDRFSPRIDAAKTAAGSYLLYSPFKPFINIYEWHCKNTDELRMMVTFALDVALKTKSELIQLICNYTEEEKLLNSMGFVRARNIEKIIYYSEKKLLENAENFYFTLYDSDLQL